MGLDKKTLRVLGVEGSTWSGGYLGEGKWVEKDVRKSLEYMAKGERRGVEGNTMSVGCLREGNWVRRKATLRVLGVG